ncbi:MAG: Clp protease ClpP [Alistipes sp.]|nr:Clp protease ClpP [Alistipes sp.]
MKTHIQIKNEAECCLIEIEGTIGVPEEWQFDDPDTRVATYERFRESVARIAAIDADEVVVTIRSTGGDVNDALLIHDALCQLKGKVTTRCYGYTASAATIIAQAASEGCREISANALYLIHRATSSVEGNAEELEAQIALLRATDDRLASLYADRSGEPKEQFEALMAENGGAGRWLTPEEVLEAGLADRIIGQASERRSLTQNLTAGLHRLAEALGFGEREALPEDRQTLRTTLEERELQRRASMLLNEGQQTVKATDIAPIEDPAMADRTLSANEKAYAHDAKAFRRN